MRQSKVKPDNYIVIQGWMLSDLKLKGNALLIYAAIWGFSQGDNQFTGSIQYLADWTNSTKEGVRKVLNKLVGEGLLLKEEEYINNVKCCKYTAVKKFDSTQQSCISSQQSCVGGSQQSCIDGSQQSWTNNIDIDNKENNINKDNIANKKSAKAHSKKSKSFDEILNSLNNKELEDAFKEFIKMRKEMKKPLTPYALKLAIKELFRLSEDSDEMIAIVNQSIKNSWLGLFPLKTNQHHQFQQNQMKSGNQFLDLLNEGGF